jgi:hypothetical protein
MRFAQDLTNAPDLQIDGITTSTSKKQRENRWRDRTARLSSLQEN